MFLYYIKKQSCFFELDEQVHVKLQQMKNTKKMLDLKIRYPS